MDVPDRDRDMNAARMAYALSAAMVAMGVIGALCPQSAWANEAPAVRWLPAVVGGMQEFGRLQSGAWKDVNEPFRDEWIDHLGAYYLREAVVADRLHIAVGLGGVFEFPKPEVAQAEFGGSQAKAFFLGPSIAKGTYAWGDPERPTFSLAMGMFPFKYNPDAHNLGEYLLRSGPYPTFLTTGGLSAIGSSGAMLQGFQAVWSRGDFRAEALLYTETNVPPLYDWSLAALASYTAGDGALVLGAGVNQKRLIQVRPGRTAPHTLANAYFRKAGTWYPGTPEEYTQKQAFGNLRVTEGVAVAKADLAAVNPSHPALAFLADPTAANLDSAARYAADVPAALDPLAAARRHRVDADVAGAVADSIAYWTTTDSVTDGAGNRVAYSKPGLEYFSPAGTLLMARAAFDPKRFFPSAALGPEDLKLYGEIALLGVENYPVYYTRRSDRMPFMLGFNLPAFRWLDLAAFQCEWFHSPFANDFVSLGNGRATPYFPAGTHAGFSRDAYYDASGKDDFSWSLLLQKHVLPGFLVSAQFARDHLRTVGTDWFFGSRLEPNQILGASRDWYWMANASWEL